MASPTRTLIVISARLDAAAREAVASGRWPRKDFCELQRALDADVIDYASVEQSAGARLIARAAGRPAAQAWLAFTRRGRYTSIFTDGEQTGIPLALLLRLSRRPPRHVTIGHLLTARTKRRIFRWLRPQSRIDAVLLHATSQLKAAREELGFRPDQTVLVAYQADTEFWRTADCGLRTAESTAPKHGSAPQSAIRSPQSEVPLLSTVGLEWRDYPTLIEAVCGLPVRLVIAAASHWSPHKNNATGEVPENVEVTSLNYTDLRDLYARSAFVVMPLRDIDNQAGITVLLEAMAMGKAVVVTASRGQRDVVRGRLCSADGPQGEPVYGPAPFGVTGDLAETETGLYVPPGDPAAMRAAIQYLLDHPDEAARMGANGRRLVEQHMSLDLFAQRVPAIVRGEPHPPAPLPDAERGVGPVPAPEVDDTARTLHAPLSGEGLALERAGDGAQSSAAPALTIAPERPQSLRPKIEALPLSAPGRGQGGGVDA